MDMAIYDTKVPDGVGKATPWFISVTSASGAGRLALCRPVVLGLRVRAGGWLGGRFWRKALERFREVKQRLGSKVG